MAKRTRTIVAGMLLLTLGVSLHAQKKNNNKAAPENTVAPGKSLVGKKVFYPDVYLGNSNMNGGKIKPEEFISLLKKGIHARDSAGKQYNVISFNFNYAERKLYEDSTGELVMLVDFTSEICHGENVSSALGENIYDRIKGGDTVFFNHVTVARPNATKPSDTFLAKSMKFEILK